MDTMVGINNNEARIFTLIRSHKQQSITHFVFCNEFLVISRHHSDKHKFPAKQEAFKSIGVHAIVLVEKNLHDWSDK